MRPYPRFVVFAVIVVVLLGLTGQVLLAQESRATILGRISDSTGGVIPGAEAKATNLMTGTSAEALTNDEGNYQILYLLPGKYKITGWQPVLSTPRTCGFASRRSITGSRRSRRTGRPSTATNSRSTECRTRPLTATARRGVQRVQSGQFPSPGDRYGNQLNLQRDHRAERSSAAVPASGEVDVKIADR